MNQFKISYIRPGVSHAPKYATTIHNAVNAARFHGFAKGGGSWETKPNAAKIYERVGGEGRYTEWELVATVTPDGIHTEDFDSRPSVKAKRDRIAAMQVEVNDAYSTQLRLCRIADEEYAEAQAAH